MRSIVANRSCNSGCLPKSLLRHQSHHSGLLHHGLRHGQLKTQGLRKADALTVQALSDFVEPRDAPFLHWRTYDNQQWGTRPATSSDVGPPVYVEHAHGLRLEDWPVAADEQWVSACNADLLRMLTSQPDCCLRFVDKSYNSDGDETQQQQRTFVDVPAHSQILKLHTDFFSSPRLASCSSEPRNSSTASSSTSWQPSIQDVSLAAWLETLRHLYGLRSFKDSDMWDSIATILPVATRHNMAALLEGCETWLTDDQHTFSMTSYAQPYSAGVNRWLLLSDLYQLDRVRDKCISAVRQMVYAGSRSSLFHILKDRNTLMKLQPVTLAQLVEMLA